MADPNTTNLSGASIAHMRAGSQLATFRCGRCDSENPDLHQICDHCGCLRDLPTPSTDQQRYLAGLLQASDVPIGDPRWQAIVGGKQSALPVWPKVPIPTIGPNDPEPPVPFRRRLPSGRHEMITFSGTAKSGKRNSEN